MKQEPKLTSILIMLNNAMAKIHAVYLSLCLLHGSSNGENEGSFDTCFLILNVFMYIGGLICFLLLLFYYSFYLLCLVVLLCVKRTLKRCFEKLLQPPAVASERQAHPKLISSDLFVSLLSH